MNDTDYMARALALAARGKGQTSPNPVVGCVITNGGQIVGEGYHQRAGTPHAEVHAIKQAGERARGGTLYVTLEPCAHRGRTPPCVELIIAAGIKNVVAAVADPNPLVRGQGFTRLQKAGIEVKTGVLATAATEINQPFFTWAVHRRPWVLLKWAMTLDGKIATATGDSRWVSGPVSRNQVHRWRHEFDGILVGIGTVLADDPRLTTRLDGENGCNPVRVVVDTTARLPLTAQVLTPEAPTVVAVGEQAPADRLAALAAKGAQVVRCPVNSAGQVEIGFLLRQLARDGLTSLLVEGGARVHASFLQGGWADRAAVFIAPKIAGGAGAPGPVGGVGVARMQEAWQLRKCSLTPSGEDWLLEGVLQEVNPCLPE
ncbi:MAG: bifunctional diaminohydroxyphosphoribosylaminopyrimidine deaminase/5-amino-6-(5-phosphoribosylamino)uracil reductase RibD [Heliobacteriaceae bacterium]|nr:bifunctional diaminohydroxyphosphoribosylaminopyrimidine deaminase/5-amino-6-(5-phosphoribosylamino)uracil reductase RibD [Heliobacteriaceae bacterium]